MSNIAEICSKTTLSKPSFETKNLKTKKSICRVSRLPKSFSSKMHSIQSKSLDAMENDQQILDFPTRMKLKERISELQQLNNEMKFKLTSLETKLKTKESELITSESLNRQIKQLLDKHINREQELNCQILTFEKKLAKANQQVRELEEEKKLFSIDIKALHLFKQTNKELKEHSELKDAQILDFSEQIADAHRSLTAALTKNKALESQLQELKKVEPMLDIRKSYINSLEERVSQLEILCSNLNEENRQLKCGIEQLEEYRLQYFLAMIEKDTNLFQCQLQTY
ncbi:hypothetical protein Bhyg_08080 [Pseudolycoriella hygida]|uniref:Uncharacterized protein n=1 Tax=Pseudolycoriella hygida TaxID=35572 RepID=A0A9Q0S3A7_9DIPT|nr:hypothetical protein Bhyg_08080 [Pseudolycoriella hygida]